MKVILLSILMMVSYVSFSQERDVCDEKCQDVTPNIFLQVIDYAQSKIGLRYGRNGFDCSGLVTKAFKTIGVELPHSSKMQSKLGEKVSKNDAKPGDLIFFSSPKSGKQIVGHVGIVTEVTDNIIHFVHAAVSGGIRIDNLASDYYKKHFITIKRNQSNNALAEN
jgi:cell wall-associated NlpC family hydrolase